MSHYDGPHERSHPGHKEWLRTQNNASRQASNSEKDSPPTPTEREAAGRSQTRREGDAHARSAADAGRASAHVGEGSGLSEGVPAQGWDASRPLAEPDPQSVGRSQEGVVLWRWPDSEFAYQRGWQLAMVGEDIPSAAETAKYVPSSTFEELQGEVERAEKAAKEALGAALMRAEAAQKAQAEARRYEEVLGGLAEKFEAEQEKWKAKCEEKREFPDDFHVADGHQLAYFCAARDVRQVLADTASTEESGRACTCEKAKTAEWRAEIGDTKGYDPDCPEHGTASSESGRRSASEYARELLDSPAPMTTIDELDGPESGGRDDG